ncbi:hypothetical protein Ddye_013032 [Dipteronia dyeriana]|uniref:Uncharacterized protein n=1 Tax=Dipteronia dyeriana TaxID=168575 RepID=A0AAD9X5D5_9ROSI|nr:hypothetical protein Ddye_013032 [Dipteronia dyeriana]
MDHFPCSHALVSAQERNLDLTTLCSNYYKRQTLIDAYSVSIIPVGDPSIWVVPFDIAQMVILNPISRRQAERPRAGRHVSSSERTTTQLCRRCGQLGHNSSPVSGTKVSIRRWGAIPVCMNGRPLKPLDHIQ